jgi:hypothetical protein
MDLIDYFESRKFLDLRKHSLKMKIFCFGGILTLCSFGVKSYLNEREKFVNNYKEKIKMEKYRSDLINLTDKNQNGLSFAENYKMKELMEIQDSSIDYVPTLNDLKKGWMNASKCTH